MVLNPVLTTDALRALSLKDDLDAIRVRFTVETRFDLPSQFPARYPLWIYEGHK